MKKSSLKDAFDFGTAFGKIEQHLSDQDEHLEGIESHLALLNGKVAAHEKKFNEQDGATGQKKYIIALILAIAGLIVTIWFHT